MMEIRLDGRENAKQWLASHPDKMEEIDHKVRAHYQVTEDADATRRDRRFRQERGKRCGIKDADYRYQVGK